MMIPPALLQCVVRTMRKRWWVAALGLGLAAVVALVGRELMRVDVPRPRPLVEARPVDSMLRRGGQLLAPTSAPVAAGRSHPFQVGHCGLLDDVVDFSGSYWVVDETTLSADERMQFGINAHEGTMTLVDSETAVFRNAVGGEATLRRYVGVLERGRCF